LHLVIVGRKEETEGGKLLKKKPFLLKSSVLKSLADETDEGKPNQEGTSKSLMWEGGHGGVS